MKKILVYIILIIMIVGCLTGCGKNDGKNDGASTGSADANSTQECSSNNETVKSIENEFRNQLKDSSDLSEVTRGVIDNLKDFPLSLDCVEVGEGYLNGFDNEITGFKNGVMFGPVIGSIPFVGYIFETDDAVALKKTLEDNANLRWNICTEADLMHGEILDDSHVFFIMCPENVSE